MQSPFAKQQIENWVADFCGSDAMRDFSGGIREYSGDILVKFLSAACNVRGIEPGDIEEPDVKSALLGPIAKLGLPESVKTKVPALCGALLGYLETEGRLSGGKVLGAYARALNDAYADASSGKAKPITNPGSKLGRNDPCPCGSGQKYKKCCMKD